MLRELLAYMPAHMDYLLLILTRYSGLIVSFNIFARRNIPRVARVGFIAALALITFYAFPPGSGVQYGGLIEYALLVATEFLCGAILGWVMNLFFLVVAFVSGHIIDMHMGFGMVNIFDTTSNTSVSVTGNILNILLTLMFFMLDCHTKAIYMLYSTFEVLPPGMVVLQSGLLTVVLKLISQTFLLAINVAMPFIVGGMLLELALGIVIRTVPQMNMFVVGMPLKVLLGLVLLIIVVPIYVNFSETIFTEMFYGLEQVFMTMIPG